MVLFTFLTITFFCSGYRRPQGQRAWRIMSSMNTSYLFSQSLSWRNLIIPCIWLFRSKRFFSQNYLQNSWYWINCSIVGEKTRNAQSQCFHQWRATLQQIIKNFHLFHFFPVITQDVEASEDISRETDEFDSIRRVILSFFRWNTREEREPDPKNKTQFIYRYEDDFSFVNRAQRWYMANWRMQGYPWLLSPRWAYGYPGEQESDTLTIFAVRMLNVRLYPRRCLSPAGSLHAYLHDTWISEYQLDNIEKRPRI